MGQPPGRGVDCLDGIECEPHDIEVPLRYHITYDGHDYERIPACDISHLKRNVPRYVKRGLPDFYSTGESFDLTSKLLKNMARLMQARSRAAIAWIEE